MVLGAADTEVNETDKIRAPAVSFPGRPETDKRKAGAVFLPSLSLLHTWNCVHKRGYSNF